MLNISLFQDLREIKETQVDLYRKLSKHCWNMCILLSPDNVEEPLECFTLSGPRKEINSEFPSVLISELLLTFRQTYAADHRKQSEFC